MNRTDPNSFQTESVLIFSSTKLKLDQNKKSILHIPNLLLLVCMSLTTSSYASIDF